MSLAAIVTACGGNTSTPPSPKLTSCAPVYKKLPKAKCYEKTIPIVAGVAKIAFHGLTKPPFISIQTLDDPTEVASLQSESTTAATFVITNATGKLDTKASGSLEFVVVVYNGV